MLVELNRTLGVLGRAGGGCCRGVRGLWALTGNREEHQRTHDGEAPSEAERRVRHVGLLLRRLGETTGGTPLGD